LIEAGASSSAALKTGMSVGDFITHSTLDLNPDSRLANALEMSGLRTSSESRQDIDFFITSIRNDLDLTFQIKPALRPSCEFKTSK
jgi:hypothetical protein